MRLFLVLALLPGCYLGTRMGPAYHQTADGLSRAGFEWDVTGGIEIQIDKPSKVNPLVGDTRMALGAGGLASSSRLQGGGDGGSGGSAPRTGATVPMSTAGTAEQLDLVAGFGTLEAARTIRRHIYEQDGSGMPTSGSLVRIAGAVGTGGGTATLTDEGRERWADASMSFASMGVEGGWHAQSKDTSIGILFGAGVRYTGFTADGLVRGATVSPYVSVQIEGIALFQAVMIMAQASGGGGCR